LARDASKFKGDIQHSSTFTDKAEATGKHVVTVGAGKSAIDIAVAAAKAGKSSTLVYRSAHWPVPRYLLNLVPFKWGTYSRFGHFMLPTHYDTTRLAWWFHGLLSPVKWVWWRIVETMFRAQFRVSGDLQPTVPIEQDLFSGGQILNYEFRDMVRSGKLQAIRGSIDKYTETGVLLTDGKELDADLVLYGTGFKKNYNIFDRLLQNKLDLHPDGLYLYRNIIPPRLPDVAFVGSEVSTFNNILTHGLQAQWLARILSGKINLPSSIRMQQNVELEQAWKRTWMPGTSARASIWQLHMMKYHDVLVKDMGEPHRRKGANFLAEVFVPYQAADYKSLFVHATSSSKSPEACDELHKAPLQTEHALSC
jgi:dimethylaniline monooxygenase (N-oxide forming)